MNRQGIITLAHLHVYFLKMKRSVGHIYPLTQLNLNARNRNKWLAWVCPKVAKSLCEHIQSSHSVSGKKGRVVFRGVLDFNFGCCILL